MLVPSLYRHRSSVTDRCKVNTMTEITYDVTCMLTSVPVSGSEYIKRLMFVTRRYNVEPSARTVQNKHSYTQRLRVGIPKVQWILFGASTAVALRWPTQPPMAPYCLSWKVCLCYCKNVHYYRLHKNRVRVFALLERYTALVGSYRNVGKYQLTQCNIQKRANTSTTPRRKPVIPQIMLQSQLISYCLQSEGSNNRNNQQ